jgi:uncharacterized protein YbaR (Trm112 family)
MKVMTGAGAVNWSDGAIGAWPRTHGDIHHTSQVARRRNLKVNLPDWFIGLIHCPITGTKLTLASPSQVQWLQQLQKEAGLTTKLGRTVFGELTQGLVSEDGRWFYPLDLGIVSLLPDDAISLDP